MRVSYGMSVWEWMPEEQILVVDCPISGEVATAAYRKGIAVRELREDGQKLINTSVELEKMAVLIETGQVWWGDREDM